MIRTDAVAKATWTSGPWPLRPLAGARHFPLLLRFLIISSVMQHALSASAIVGGSFFTRGLEVRSSKD